MPSILSLAFQTANLNYQKLFSKNKFCNSFLFDLIELNLNRPSEQNYETTFRIPQINFAFSSILLINSILQNKKRKKSLIKVIFPLE